MNPDSTGIRVGPPSKRRYCVVVPYGPDLQGKGYQRRAAQVSLALENADTTAVAGRRRSVPEALRTLVKNRRLPLSVLAFQTRLDFTPPDADLCVFFTSRCVPPHFPGPYIVDFVDSISDGYAHRAALCRFPPARWFWRMEASRLAAYDRCVLDGALAASAITGRDATSLGPTCQTVSYWPQIADAASPALSAGTAVNVVFFGLLSYHPNRMAAHWIEQHLVPQLGPDVRVCLLGRGGSRTTRRLPHFSGVYDTLTDVVDDRTVCVVPVVSGAGLQTKVIEAAALGLPLVITPFVAGGLAAPLPASIVVAEGPEQFARAVTSMRVTEPDRLALRAWASDHYSRAVVIANWKSFLASAGF